MVLNLTIHLHTDGDFSIRDIEKIFDPSDSMYKGADVKYKYDTEWEDIHFELHASGDGLVGANACRWAARDLMEKLICSISTHRYYIIRYLYDLIITPKEDLLWGAEDVHYENSLGGNYEGTSIRLDVWH